MVKIIYKCETCGKEYEDEDSCLKCEERHECRHLNVEYSIGREQEIVKRCSDCGIILEEIYLSEDPQELLEQIYNLIKEYDAKEESEKA